MFSSETKLICMCKLGVSKHGVNCISFPIPEFLTRYIFPVKLLIMSYYALD